MKNKRNIEINFAKGIAICLMVIGHANVTPYLGRFIYLFHMPLFFILSGYFFPCIKINTLTDCLKYWVRKMRGLYFPFIKWCIVFLFLSFLLYNLGLEKDLLSIEQLKDRLFHQIFFMEKYGLYLVGYWFIHDLFIISIVCSILAYIFNKFNLYFFVLLIPLFLTLSVFFAFIMANNYAIGIPVQEGIRRLCLGFAFFIFGYYYKQIEEISFYSWTNFTIIFILLCTQASFEFMDMAHISFNWTVPYFIFAVLGTFMILNLAYLLPKNNKLYKFITYAGEHSLIILTFHILVFRMLNYVIVHILNLNKEHVYDFPSIKLNNQIIYCLIYSILAISIPLLCVKLKDSLIAYYKKYTADL